MRRFGVKRAFNAMGMSTILGANTASEEVRRSVDEALQTSVEIDELQAAACRVIARSTGAEAGCVTSSCSAAMAISAAAAMTGANLAKIAQLPDTHGLPSEIVLPLAHDVNFGAPISQMIRLSGATVVRPGTASHFDGFHLRGVLSERTAAMVYVDSDDVNPAGSFLPLEECIEAAHLRGVPVIVDSAAGGDVRPFLKLGVDLVITSAHKQMGAPTSGMICGKLELVRACYLQNYGVGRAMKVGKEGIAGCMTAVEEWYSRDVESEKLLWKERSTILAERLQVRASHKPSVLVCAVPSTVSARAVANRLREGDTPVWVKQADDAAGELHFDLRVMSNLDAALIAERVADALMKPTAPVEDVPYHDLYWSERRLLEWPDWR